MKVVEKIISDAQSEYKKIIEEAELEVKKINNTTEAEIEKIEKEIKNEVSQLKEKEKSILIGKEKMASRNEILQIKRKIIEDIFDEAIKIAIKEKNEYLKIIENLIKKIEIKEGEIVIGINDTAIDITFIEKINKEIGANFYLSKDRINISGGFVLRHKEIEIDASFSTLLKTKKEKIEIELNKILF